MPPDDRTTEPTTLDTPFRAQKGPLNGRIDAWVVGYAPEGHEDHKDRGASAALFIEDENSVQTWFPKEAVPFLTECLAVIAGVETHPRGTLDRIEAAEREATKQGRRALDLQASVWALEEEVAKYKHQADRDAHRGTSETITYPCTPTPPSPWLQDFLDITDAVASGPPADTPAPDAPEKPKYSQCSNCENFCGLGPWPATEYIICVATGSPGLEEWARHVHGALPPRGTHHKLKVYPACPHYIPKENA